MTLNLEAIKAKSDLARTMTEDYTATIEVGDLNFVEIASYLPALVAEVERLRKVEAAARAWREVFRSPPKLRTPHNHRSYSHAVSNARCRVFAALDAAQGGG